jgi:conjugal transfer mating pair stabilization protein TraG
MANADFVVYTLGDTASFEAMLQGVALIFQDPFYSGDAAFGLGYGVFLGALILFTMAIYQSALKQKFEMRMLIAPLIFYVMLTLPKTTITVVDAYNQEAPKQVSNIPIGLALPLSLASGIAQGFTQSMETAYSTPSSPRLLVDGFTTPLKTLYALRYVNISEDSPYISNMINQINHSCVVGDARFDPDEYKNSSDGYRYFLNFLYDKATGIVTLRNIDGSYNTYSCYQAASELQKSFEAFVYGDGTKSGTLNYNFKRALNGAVMMTDGAGKLGKSRDYNDVMTSFAQITDTNTNDGRQFLLNTLFNQPLQSASHCANNKGSTEANSTNLAHCASWITSDAQLAEDNAAGATGFFRMLQDGQNILLILAILLFPLVVIMIVFMGPKSVVVVSSYLMYLASVYLWMPMASIVNFYSYIKIKNTIYTFSGSNTGELFAISDYPAFYQAVSDSLSVANGLTAILPIFCMMFFSGLTMAMVGFMRRMDASKSSYYDAKMNAPDVVSPSPFANKTSMSTSNGMGAVTDSNGGKAFTMSNTQSFEASASQMVALQKKKADLEGKAQNLTAQINSMSNTTVNGGITENRLSDIKDKTRKDFISGHGFTQTYTENDQGKLSTDAKATGLKSTENNNISDTNSVGAIASLGFGLKLGKGNTFSAPTISADGTPLASQNAGTQQVVPQGAGDNAYSFGPLQGKAGVAAVTHLGHVDIDTSQIDGQEKNSLYQGNGQTGKEYSEDHHKVLGGFQETKTLGGNSHGVEKSVSTATGDSIEKSQAYSNGLKKSLSDTNAEIEQINKTIAQIASSSFTTNMLDSDILHRVTRHESIRSDLDRIDREYRELYGDKWDKAKQNAAAHAQMTELSVSQYANPEQFAYYTVVMAGMAMSYESANATFKALTGFEAPNYNLDQNLKSANTDWSKMNIDHGDLEANFTKRFGATQNLDGQYAYLAGELEVHGERQQRNMIMVYNSFLHAGFSPNQAIILTAEVGRENSFNSASLFGTHYDPEKKHLTNGGMISFNQDRKIDLDKEMMAKGLVSQGKIGTASYVQSQESLDAMAQFMHKELSTQSRYSTAWKALNDDSLSTDQVHYAVGKNYIVWRIDDEKYRENGERNRKDFADKINAELVSQSKAKYEPSPIGGLSSSDFSTANNPSLTAALARTGLKGQVLGNGLVDNKYISNAGLPIKAPSNNRDQAYGGGQSRGYTVEFAHLTNQKLGGKVKYFSGFNDEYHKNVGSTGKHVEGRAFDLVLNNPNDAKSAIAEMQKLAKQHGYKVAFVNEYQSKSKDFTGQHLHVSVLGRDNVQQSLVAKEIQERQSKAATAMNQADATRTQILRPVNKSVGTFVPQGEGTDYKHKTLGELKTLKAEKTSALTSEFNKATQKNHGVSVAPDKNGEDVHFTVVDKGKFAENLQAKVPSGLEATKMLKENVANAFERNTTMPADLHLDRAMSKTNEAETPKYSDFNINRQKHVEAERVKHDEQLEKNTGLNRIEVGQDRRAIEESADATRENLKDALIQKKFTEMDRRFNVIKDELKDNPVPRSPNAPASLNSALVGKNHEQDPSRATLTADNLTVSEAIVRYNAKREALDKD